MVPEKIITEFQKKQTEDSQFEGKKSLSLLLKELQISQRQIWILGQKKYIYFPLVKHKKKFYILLLRIKT